MHRSIKRFIIGATAILALLQSASVSAEPRYYDEGYVIDYEIWLEDARIDPVKYFVFPNSLNRHNKCASWIDEEPVEDFFEHFNALVETKVFDLLDVLLVWSMRECLNNEDMQDRLGVSRNTYFRRLDKIRSQMLIRYQ